VEKLIQLWSQHPVVFVAGALLVLVLALAAALVVRRNLGRKNAGAKGAKIDPQLSEDLAKGDFRAAAERELKAGNLAAAYGLFLRAHQPARAAQIAVHQGRLQDAADLFEKAGNRKRAAEIYRQVGMEEKAEELLAEEDRVVRQREEQKAALRKRLEQEPEEDVASLDPTTWPAQATPAAVGHGLPSAVDETAGTPPSEALALAPTQAAMPSLAAAFDRPIVSPPSGGVQQEAPAPYHAAGSAVNDAPPMPTLPAAPTAARVTTGPEPESDGPIVEEMPEEIPRAERATPRTPFPVVGPSVGSYRMRRPSEPDVFTPPPMPKPAASEGATPGPARKPALPSGEWHASGNRNATPGPRLSLSLGTKPGSGATSPPTSSKGTALGLGPTRPGK
jgi:hypothetical protein